MSRRVVAVAVARAVAGGLSMLLAIGSGACSGMRAAELCRSNAGRGSACELDSPEAVPGDFLLRQLVVIDYGEHRLRLETVVQKRGDTLTMIGLTPVAGTLFTLVLRGNELAYDSAVWRELPFPPCRIVRDFERIHFPLVGDDTGNAQVRIGSVAGEDATESRHDGRPLRRHIGESDCGGAPVIVDFLDWDDERGLPVRAKLVDSGEGYSMDIELLSAQPLSQ